MVLGGLPVVLDGLHIPQALFPGLTRAEFVGRDATMYDLYRERFGITVVKTVDRVSALAADAETAKKLDLALGTPLLEIVRVASTVDDRVVELRRSLIHTDNYEFLDITGGPAPG
ncbi:MAG TPA: UTRA domain-containing protein, partial [Rhodocyclaceae bacterium]|nr:UTRA domain-containing protein [Rhodocyclaceae bacterium]